MNFFNYKTRRTLRDDIVKRLDTESNGSFSVLSRALESVSAKHPHQTDLDVEEVVKEIRRLRGSVNAKSGVPRQKTG